MSLFFFRYDAGVVVDWRTEHSTPECDLVMNRLRRFEAIARWEYVVALVSAAAAETHQNCLTV